MNLPRIFRGLASAVALAGFVAFGIWLLQFLLMPQSAGRVNYADFQRLLDDGQVQRVVIRENQAEVTLKAATSIDVSNASQARQVRSFSVSLPTSSATPDSTLIRQLEQKGVELRFERPRQWLGILLNLLPIILMVIIPVLLFFTLVLWVVLRRSPTAPTQQ